MVSEETENFRVLIVDDEHYFAQALGRAIERQGMTADLAYSAAEALDLADNRHYNVILLDHKLPDDDGIRIIPLLLSRQLRTSIVMMTAFETIPNAIQAIRQGAEDYLVKQTTVKPIIEKILKLQRMERVREGIEGWEEHKREGLLGKSSNLLHVMDKIRKVASSPETTVLLSGESGVGKEVAAMQLHRQSVPAGTPFIPVDCVALPHNLVESLLFGHEKGAFTGADRTTEGAFVQAGKGTIFLDEIGEMSLDLQGKLLRVLESRKCQRVGSVQQQDIKARIVAATNRDLKEWVDQGRFRFDLYQRLSVFPIHIPPLRERQEDILALAEHFLYFVSRKLGRAPQPFSKEVHDLLMQYDYPGNVRELKNVIERAVIMAEGESIGVHHFPERMLRRISGEGVQGDSFQRVPVSFIPGIDTLETFEKKMIIYALKQAKGVKTEAARQLGISRFQLIRRLEKYELNDNGD
ncbi:MAG: sigma-54-dependent Fis family transcriptional regulator [Myxococcales bacterium]|nr:MAG: sigma-54-dependent Fis family transcriptional regulator [Myxococcales bacterium]